MLPPRPNSESKHKCAQFRGSECSQAATTPFFAKSSTWIISLAKKSPTAFVLSWPTTSCPPLLPNQAPLLYFVTANYLLPPFLPNRASRCSVWQKRTLPPLFCHGRPPSVPVFAKSNTWMLGLAKTSPTAFVLSWPIATCPRFCQIEHLNAQVGKNIRKNTLSLERPRKYPKGCPNTT